MSHERVYNQPEKQKIYPKNELKVKEDVDM
jgi:hypothetical protein